MKNTNNPSLKVSRKGEKEENTKCNHTQQYEDDIRGDVICTSCGLVIEKIFHISHGKCELYKTTNIREELLDLSERIHFPKSVVNRTLDIIEITKQNENVKKWLKKRKENEKGLIVFILNETLKEYDCPRILSFLIIEMNTKYEVVLEIEKIIPLQKKYCPIENYVDTLCSPLNFNFQDIKKIKFIVSNFNDVHQFREQTRIAAAIIIFQEIENKRITSLKTICQNFQISRIGVKKIMKIVKSSMYYNDILQNINNL